MRWQGRQGSQNIEDRRGQKSSMRRIGGGIGIGTILLIIATIIFGGDPSEILSSVQQQGQTQQSTNEPYVQSAQEQELAGLVSVVLKETEDVWGEIFQEQLGRRYKPTVLVLFSGSSTSACGAAKAATGPFYCPADEKVYIDLSFYEELRTKFRAGGDFAMAYVVAHEIAHHVQNQLGITRQMDAQRGRVSKTQYNDLSVRLELQADFFSGVWAHHAHKRSGLLERGDIEEAMNAAAAIGDDRIQMQSRGYIQPESFTHGTSEQRQRWLRKGLETGDVNQGDTFAARSL